MQQKNLVLENLNLIRAEEPVEIVNKAFRYFESDQLGLCIIGKTLAQIKQIL